MHYQFYGGARGSGHIRALSFRFLGADFGRGPESCAWFLPLAVFPENQTMCRNRYRHFEHDLSPETPLARQLKSKQKAVSHLPELKPLLHKEGLGPWGLGFSMEGAHRFQGRYSGCGGHAFRRPRVAPSALRVGLARLSGSRPGLASSALRVGRHGVVSLARPLIFGLTS